MAARTGCRPLGDAVKMILQGLNVAQKAAVTSSAPVLQVLAPPGSGKTKTLTSRVAYLLAHEQYAPWNVICCTFTIKASREMRERLRGMIGEELESKLILGTFHSVCRRYLVTYGHLIGIPKGFGVADSDDSLNIIKRTIKRLKLSIDPRVARSRISHRKARGKRLEDVSKSIHNSVDAQEFATVFREYEEALALSNLLDYDDLLMRCVDLLRQHPECVSNVEALLIDEFQDTNVVQFELMKLLASAQKRVTIVGDPDQSIYGFRSAEIENLLRMRAFYPDTVVINLEENYRSASAVLRLAQEVIEQDNDRPQKKLKSTHCYGTLPVLRKLPNPNEEAQWIVSEIKRMTAMTGDLIKLGDIAILLRSAFLSLLIEKALANAGLPYRMVGGRRFFDRVEVRILLDYLRTISHPDNTSALLAIINTPTRKIGEGTVKELTRVAEQEKESLWSVCQKVLGGQLRLEKKLSKPAEQGLNELVSLVQKARRSLESTKPEDAPGSLIQFVVKSLNYKAFLKRQYPDDHGERWENVQELLTQATDASLRFNAAEDQLPIVEGAVQGTADGASEVLSRFLANVVLSTEVESNTDGEEKPRVTLSTIHAAKGLEWPVIFVPAVYEGSIPHSRSEDTNEERRLLYVAMTRAKALLYMTFPVMQSREDSESVLSQFLSAKMNPFISSAGPRLDDRVIQDIASILRVPPPSQEAIAQGHLRIEKNESQHDDIWPDDGSHRKALVSTGNDHPSFILQRGQSLSDALRSSGPCRQQSNYSTLTESQHSFPQMSTTMTNLSALSTSNMSTAFTTAHQHFRSMPQLKEETAAKPTLVKSASDGTFQSSKKPKLVKSSSGQGNISSFFLGSSAKPTTGFVNTGTPSTTSMQKCKVELPLPSLPPLQRTTRPEESIPAELSTHRPAHGLSFSNKRPRTVLGESKATRVNQGEKRNYGFLSSSPTRERPDEKMIDEKLEETEKKAFQSDFGNTSISGPAMSSSSSTATSVGRNNMSHSSFRPVAAAMNGSSSISSFTNNSFQKSQISRLTPLNGLGGGSLQGGRNDNAQTHQARRTLGVRRSMNGWENRKNK